MSKVYAPGNRIVGGHLLPTDDTSKAPWKDLDIGDGLVSAVISEYELANTPSGSLKGTIEALVKKIDELESRIIALETAP